MTAGRGGSASLAHRRTSAVVPKVTLWFLVGDTMATQYDSVARESFREAKCVADGSTTGALQQRRSIRIANRFVWFLA